MWRGTLLFLAIASAVEGSPLGLRVDSYLTRLEGYGYSGSILLEVDGRVLLRKAYGQANQEAGAAYTAETAFDIGSMAKTFTATAVLQLEDRGSLVSGDSIVRFLPNVPPDKRGVTIAQLLSHTGGVAGDVPSRSASPFADEVGRDEVVARILAAPLAFPPGTRWSYSNGGYVLLAAIVEKASGRPFRDYVRQEIWSRAGMKNTHFWGEPMTGPVAAGHDGAGKVVFDPAKASGTTWFDLGGGQVVSTLDDLRSWIRAIATDTVLSAKQRRAMLTPHDDPAGSPTKFRTGYAWRLQETPRGTHLAMHGGDYLGTGAELTWWIDENTVLVTSTNVRHDFYPTRNRVDRVLRPMFFGERTEPDVPTFVRADVAPPAGLAGTYRLASGGTLQVFTLHGRLHVGATGQDATALLSGSTPEVEKEREWRSASATRAVSDLMKGKPEALDLLAGSTAANHGFRDAMRDEIAALSKRPLTDVSAIGSFASGFPVGPQPVAETTLLRLRFQDVDFYYAVRWDGRRIGATEVVLVKQAATVPLQQMLDRSWAGWNLVTETKLILRVVSPDAIEIRSGERTATATRISGE